MTTTLLLAAVIAYAAVFTRPPDRRPLRYLRHYRRARRYTDLRESADVEMWLAAIQGTT